jgi:hypothetical protein
MSAPILPDDYQSVVSQVMDPYFQAREDLEDYGHLNYWKRGEEFDLSRGYTVLAYGWSMFCDEVGPFEGNTCRGSKIVGNLYDAENGLGYIGYISEVDGKPYPIIHTWAMRTRLEHPRKGRFGIDKTDAIYYYESLDMC